MNNENAIKQLKELDIRLGKGVGATKERAKLHKLLGTDTQKPKKEDNLKNQNLKGKKGKDEKDETD